jgi:hypothetical protein
MDQLQHQRHSLNMETSMDQLQHQCQSQSEHGDINGSVTASASVTV